MKKLWRSGISLISVAAMIACLLIVPMGALADTVSADPELFRMGLETATASQLNNLYYDNFAPVTQVAMTEHVASGCTSAAKLTMNQAAGWSKLGLYNYSDGSYSQPSFNVLPEGLSEYSMIRGHIYVPYSECTSSNQVPSGLQWWLLGADGSELAVAKIWFDEWNYNSAEGHAQCTDMDFRLRPSDFRVLESGAVTTTCLTAFPDASYLEFRIDGGGPDFNGDMSFVTSYCSYDGYKPCSFYLSGLEVVPAGGEIERFPMGLETATASQLNGLFYANFDTITQVPMTDHVANGCTSAVKVNMNKTNGWSKLGLYNYVDGILSPAMDILPDSLSGWSAIRGHIYVPYNECSTGMVPSGLQWWLLGADGSELAVAKTWFNEWYMNDPTKCTDLNFNLRPSDFRLVENGTVTMTCLTEFPDAAYLEWRIQGGGPDNNDGNMDWVAQYCATDGYKPCVMYLSGLEVISSGNTSGKEIFEVGLENASSSQIAALFDQCFTVTPGQSAPYLASGYSSAMKLAFAGEGTGRLILFDKNDYTHPLLFPVFPEDLNKWDYLEAYIYVPYNECAKGMVPSGLQWIFVDQSGNTVGDAVAMTEFTEWYCNGGEGYAQYTAMALKLAPADFGLEEFPQGAYTLEMRIDSNGPNPDYAGDNIYKPCNIYLSGLRFTRTPKTEEHVPGEWVVTTEPTCTEPGERTQYCTECGEPVATEEIAALGHDWSADWTIVKAAGLDTTGLACHKCTRCGVTDENVTVPAIGTNHNGWYTEPYSGMQYYFLSGELNTEPRATIDGVVCNFYPADSIVDGIDVSYSYLLGWKKMPNKITRYYEEGEYFFKTGFQSVDGKKYFFNKTSGALYIPNAGVGGMGWYKSGDAYYALSPVTGEWIVGLYTDANGDTYYYKKYDTKAGYTTGLVDIDGETYYFDPANGKMVKGTTVDFGNHQLTFDENGALVKTVGVYNGYCYDENGDLYAGGLLIEAGGNLYRTTTGGKLDSNFWNRADPRDSSKKIYLYKGVVLEGMVTIDYGTWTYNNKMGFSESGTYFFEGNTVTPSSGFFTAGNGLEYYFSANGKRYENAANYGYINKVIYNFYAKNTVVDGVDLSYSHKVGLVTENGVLHYYQDGTRGYLKDTTVTDANGVVYTIAADGAVHRADVENMRAMVTAKAQQVSISDEILRRGIVSEGNRARIAAAIKKAVNGEDITLGVLGGSITEGAGASAYANCYASQFKSWWENLFPNSHVTLVNAGKGSTGSVIGVHCADDHILAYDPDVVIVEYAVNDSEVDFYRDAYESVIRKLWTADCEPALLLLFTMNSDGSNRQESMSATGAHYDLPMLSYRDAIFPEVQAGTFSWSYIGSDGVHPSDNGHAMIGALIATYLIDVYEDLYDIDDVAMTVLPEPLYGDSFINGRLYDSTNLEADSLGSFTEVTGGFYQFPNGWEVKNGGTGSLVFTIPDCTSIYILTNRVGDDNAGIVNIVAEGETTQETGAMQRYPGLGFSYADPLCVYTGTTPTTVTLTVTLQPESANSYFNLLALMVA